jgi:hypothetical protein
MRYSWTEFAVGVAVGGLAVTLAFVLESDQEMCFGLLVVSFTLMWQVPESIHAVPPGPPSVTDADEWRAAARGCIAFLSSRSLYEMLGCALALVMLNYGWTAALNRLPALARLPRDPAPYGLAAIWLLHAVRAFRSAKAHMATGSI